MKMYYADVREGIYEVEIDKATKSCVWMKERGGYYRHPISSQNHIFYYTWNEVRAWLESKIRESKQWHLANAEKANTRLTDIINLKEGDTYKIK